MDEKRQNHGLSPAKNPWSLRHHLCPRDSDPIARTHAPATRKTTDYGSGFQPIPAFARYKSVGY